MFPNFTKEDIQERLKIIRELYMMPPPTILSSDYCSGHRSVTVTIRGGHRAMFCAYCDMLLEVSYKQLPSWIENHYMTHPNNLVPTNDKIDEIHHAMKKEAKIDEIFYWKS